MLGELIRGEILGSLRVVNSVVGAGLIVIYVTRSPGQTDRIDRLVLLSLVLFAAAAVGSTFPRQSLDALLAALAYAAAFYVARDAFSNPSAARVMVWTLRVLSVVITALIVMRLLPLIVQWWSLTNGAVMPPVGLRFSAQPWGNQYDLVMLAVMLYPAWLIGPMGRARMASALIVGVPLALAVLFQGARATWLAIAVATAVVVAPGFLRWIPRAKNAVPLLLVAGALGAVIVIALGSGILDRLLTFATVGQRLEMWTAATQAWLEHPIQGLGPGSFPWVLQTTDYFATNSIHPRHPDSALFQLLPEAGILGLASAVVLLVAVVPALIRSENRPAMWAIAVFVFGGIGANPTDFPFLLATAIVWAGLALPRIPEPSPTDEAPSPFLRTISYACMALIAVAVSAHLVAGISYDEAARAAHADDLKSSRRHLDVAIAFDPGMAIYSRQRGFTSLLLEDPESAVDDLRRATRLNPNDDLSWRALALALAARGDVAGSARAVDRAIEVQPSDVTNLLVRAHGQSMAHDAAGLRDTVGEIALAWPTIVAAPGWDDVVGGLISPREAIGLAIDRWQNNRPSREPLISQPLWLATFGERPDLIDAAMALSGLDPAMAEAAVATWHCDPSASDRLEAMAPSLRQSSAYWALLVQLSAERGKLDQSALKLYGLASGTEPTVPLQFGYLDPLHENNAQGSVDGWGYDRGRIFWSTPFLQLPDANAGAARVRFDPSASREAMGFTNGPGLCR